LPFVENKNLQKLINFDEPLYLGSSHSQTLNSAQALAARSVVALFRCPSDYAEDQYAAKEGEILAGGNYMVCSGSGTGTTYDLRYPTDGVFYYNSARGFRHIDDGSSNTLLMAESLLGLRRDISGALSNERDVQRGIGSLGGSPNSSGPGLAGITDPDLKSIAEGCSQWSGNRGFGWIVGKPYAATFTTYLSPNSDIPDMASMGIGFYGSRSNHPGGVQALFADGGVRFIEDNIRPSIWRAMATCDGGEALEALKEMEESGSAP